eukprot:Gb_17297 [translate_table: standard]
MVLHFVFVDLQVYAWELPGVAGNACNGLTPTIALQLAAVVYGANLFSVLLEDLEAACRFVEDGALQLKNLCDLRSVQFKNPWTTSLKLWNVEEAGDGARTYIVVFKNPHGLWNDYGDLCGGADFIMFGRDVFSDHPLNRTTSKKLMDNPIYGLENLSWRPNCMRWVYKVNEDSAWPLAPVWPGAYAWELLGVARNAYNGLTPTVALQLAAVIYGANLFSVLLEDLEAAWLLECL